MWLADPAQWPRTPGSRHSASPISIRNLVLQEAPAELTLCLVEMSHISRAVYSTVPLEDKSDIRLLVVHPGSGDDPICCSLKTVPLSEHPRYDALSYAWGPPEQVKVLQLLDAPVKVRENLWWALVHLRLPTQDWVVWVDALCIDQSNIGERNHQVRLMSQIFTNAEIVVAWLGCEADDSDLIMDYLAGAPIELDADDPLLDSLDLALGISGSSRSTRASIVIGQRSHLIPYNDILRKSLRKIYGRSYWQRMWVLQEFGLANDVVVCCGKKMVPWNAFLLLEDDFASTENRRPDGPHRPATTLLQYRKDRVGMPQRLFTEIYNLISLVLLFGDRLCSDPKDKIYALLSMAVDCQHDEIIVDYSKTLFSIYCDALQQCLGKSASKWNWLTSSSIPWANQENQPVMVLQVIIRSVLCYALNTFADLGWPEDNGLVRQGSREHRQALESDLFGDMSAGRSPLSTYQRAWTALLQVGRRAINWLVPVDEDIGKFDEELQLWPLHFPIEVRDLSKLYLFISVYSVYDKIDLMMTEAEVIIRPKGEGLSIIIQRETEEFLVRKDNSDRN
jgi:hypothetical protein